MSTTEQTLVRVVADGHVHFHECFDIDDFLGNAFSNLRDGAGRVSGNGHMQTSYALMFTEGADEHFFASLASKITDEEARVPVSSGSSWFISGTDENESLWARHEDGRELLLIAGCQIAAREDIEVLHIGTTERVPDGRPLREVLAACTRGESLAVIPWGFGKWLSSRGRLLEDVINEFAAPVLFLGDQSGRPAFWPMPKPITRAEALGVRNLPGTDPFPFSHEVRKVGRTGFSVPVMLDRRKPARSVISALSSTESPIERFTKLEPFLMFLRNQIQMQVRKRIRA